MLFLLLLLLAGCSQKPQNTNQTSQQIVIIDEAQIMSSFPEYKEARERLVATAQELEAAKDELMTQANKERERLKKLQQELEKVAKTDISKLPAKQKAFAEARDKSADLIMKLQQKAIALEEKIAEGQVELGKLVHKFKERNHKALEHVIKGSGGNVLVIGLPETRVLHCDAAIDKTAEMINFLHKH